MKFSVIIPVYNSEKYIKDCIDSILMQSYSSYEIILVDDESTDKSPAICDDYAKKDHRIKVIHKKNSGTASSRNVGLTHCCGDYIMFMDNDDFWDDSHALADINGLLEESKPDVLLYLAKEYWENKNQYVIPQISCDREQIFNKNKSDALEYIISQGALYRAVWAKVVSKRLIQEHNLRFEDGIRNEDTDFTAKLILNANKYDWYDKKFYVYRKGTGVAQTNQKMKYSFVNDLVHIIEKYTFIGNQIEDVEFRKVFFSYLAYPYAVLMGQLEAFKSAEANLAKKENKKNSYLLGYDLDPSVRKIKLIYRCLGYTITAKLLKGYMKL